MLTFFKKIFPKIRKYSLKIYGTTYKKNNLVCFILDTTNVSKYELYAYEIFSRDELLCQFSPRELLKLKELYDQRNDKYVSLLESQRNNKYKIHYLDHEFIMSGNDICKDINLLKSMRTQDAFKIIYDTAYLCGISDSVNAEREEANLNEKENIIYMKKLNSIAIY